MGRFAFAGLIAALALGACAPRASECSLSATKALTFSSEQDVVVTRAFGPGCDRAVGVLVIETAEGHPVWTFAAPLYPTFGNLFEPHGAEPTRETVQAFLTRWAEPRAGLTGEAPPWERGAETIAGGAATTLDRATYEDVRARGLPMVCHLSGVARETCVFWEPGAAAGAALLERDAPAATR